MLASIGAGGLWGCGDELVEPPVRLTGEYRAISSAYGPLPVRFDHLLASKPAWFIYMERVTLRFDRDGGYHMIQEIRDSFPTSGSVSYRQHEVIGTYEVREDTVIRYTIDQDESFALIGPSQGRVWPDDRVTTNMLGMVYEKIW